MRLMSDLKSETATAMKAVHAASHICAAVQQNLVTADSMSKKDRSPVAVADFASQAVVCSMLQQAFPDDPVVGEENAKALRSDEQAVLRQSVVHHASSVLAQTFERPPTEDQVLDLIDHGNGEASTDRYWTVDPIDGTKGFLRGQQYCIARLREMIGERDIHIEIDGGVTPDTAGNCAAMGADVLVAGSAVFKGGSVAKPEAYGANIRAIREAATSAL